VVYVSEDFTLNDATADVGSKSGTVQKGEKEGGEPYKILATPPEGGWDTGLNQALTISVKDLNGSIIPFPNIEINVAANVLYVIESSPGAPARTFGFFSGDNNHTNIQSAINAAAPGDFILLSPKTFASLDELLTNQGLYIIGGFSADFKTFDPKTYRPTIQGDLYGTILRSAAGMLYIRNVDFYADGEIDGSNLVFIQGNNGAWLDISNCTFKTSSDYYSGSYTGISVDTDAGKSIIANNQIYLDSLSNSSPMEGIRVTNTFTDGLGALIYNNVVELETTGEARGVYWKSGTQDVSIFNNTMILKGIDSAGVLIAGVDSSTTVRVENNIFHFDSSNVSSSAYFVTLDTINSPYIFKSNILTSPNDFYVQYDHEGTGNSLNTNHQNDGNIRSTVTFNHPIWSDNPDYSLDASSPQILREGGLDGAAEGYGFSTDILGHTRPSGKWSVGAYQYFE
jgi:hypothetical protein